MTATAALAVAAVAYDAAVKAARPATKSAPPGWLANQQAARRRYLVDIAEAAGLDVNSDSVRAILNAADPGRLLADLLASRH